MCLNGLLDLISVLLGDESQGYGLEAWRQGTQVNGANKDSVEEGRCWSQVVSCDVYGQYSSTAVQQYTK